MMAIAQSPELGGFQHQATVIPETRRQYLHELQHAAGRNALEQLASTLQEGR